MNTLASTLPTTYETAAINPKLDALLLIAAALLSFAPLAILAPAIGWPASLSAPAAQQLAAIAAKPQAVQQGYGVYLLYSILVLPVMVVLARRVFGSLAHPLAITAISFAALSALARSIGILRWLTVMPELAVAHAQADATQRAVIERVFQAVNAYGGGIGELLGVGLFMSLSVGIVAIAALKRHSLPAPLALLGIVCAAMLFSMLMPALGLGLKLPIAIIVTMLTVWMLVLGVWMLMKRS
jgi:Domain of unknown function (DUF4386)